MAPKRKARAEPGDYRLDPHEFLSGEQPLNGSEKELLKRGYDLFDEFKSKLADAHEAMLKARRMRQLRQDEKSKTAPLSMTLNSCVDNVIADQVDNMPEAVMVPEREETAKSAEEMTDVVSYVLEQAGWPGKYQTSWKMPP